MRYFTTVYLLLVGTVSAQAASETASMPPFIDDAITGRQLQSSAPTTCDNTCRFANDGECDDGGPGAQHSQYCECGTDCADCNRRDTCTYNGPACPCGGPGSSIRVETHCGPGAGAFCGVYYPQIGRTHNNRQVYRRYSYYSLSNWYYIYATCLPVCFHNCCHWRMSSDENLGASGYIQSQWTDAMCPTGVVWEVQDSTTGAWNPWNASTTCPPSPATTRSSSSPHACLSAGRRRSL